MSLRHESKHAVTARRIPLAAILFSLLLFAITAVSMAAGLAFLRSGANFRVDSAAFIAAVFFGVLAVGIPAVLIRERRTGRRRAAQLRVDLAGLSAVSPRSATPPR
jgi:membrane associated rhomboid family serine protease